MSRFFVPPENVDVKANKIMVDKDEAHHIIDVMRMKESDAVVIFDGTGKEYTGFIETLDSKAKRLIVTIVKTEHPAPQRYPEIYLAQAIPKKNRMVNIIEKATELGVNCVIPVLSERTIVRPDNVDAEKMAKRWRKIATVAAKQSGRVDVPTIGRAVKYNDFVKSFGDYDIVLFACLFGDAVPLREALSTFMSGKVLIVVGPEGDFSPNEAHMAVRDNCKFVSLGKRVLKSDTAGIFMLSVLKYEFSE